jgi:hypothetical protein
MSTLWCVQVAVAALAWADKNCHEGEIQQIADDFEFPNIRGCMNYSK